MKVQRTWGLLQLGTSILLCATSAFCSGCLRYVPSQEEVAQQYASHGEIVGGETEFKDYEASLRRRLERIATHRAHLLTQGASEGSYRLGAGDLVSIDVYGFPDLKTETEISPSGTVTLPLVGDIALGGQSVARARSSLSQAYSHYIKAPKVDVSLKGYEANRVSVIGAVAKPGVYPLKRNGQLLTDLLSEAGGKTQMSGNRIILLPAPTMNNGGKGVTATPVSMSSGKAGDAGEEGSGVEIEMDDLLGGINRRPILVPLMPGDTILVPEVGKFEVDGEVTKPGSYPLASRTSAIGAVAAAGGFTYSADVNKVEVIRDLGNGKKALLTLDLEEVGLRGGKDVPLRDGDLVRVPSEPGRFFRRQIVETLNTIFSGVGVSARR